MGVIFGGNARHIWGHFSSLLKAAKERVTLADCQPRCEVLYAMFLSVGFCLVSPSYQWVIDL